MLLFHPRRYDAARYDEPTRRALLAVRDWFEAKGHDALKNEYVDRTWYDDFLEMIGREGVFARFGTPSAVGALLGGPEGGDPEAEHGARWDTARNNDLNQLIGWYSLEHWYAWQVTVLGLGPVWTSENEAAKALVGKLLASGGVFAFGLSERTHGADIYATDMILTDAPGGWSATGPKYYIGNGNCAARVSVFGRFDESCDPARLPAGAKPGDYVFFLADPAHEGYHLVRNVVAGQMFVAEFTLDDYPVAAEDVLHVGRAAWDAALATVNVGKVQLAWTSLGIAQHAFVEAVDHAHNRHLYSKRVTDFPHVRRLLVDSYVRMLAMSLYSGRCSDYERSASADDRRFLLYNPIAKMKVTSEGERVIDHLWDVVAAKGFERDTYFDQATRHIRTLPKLEGTVHVNLALVLKFLPAYAAAGVDAPPSATAPGSVPVRLDPADDTYLFAQGPASGLGSVRFPDWRPAFARFAHLPNVARFLGQVAAFGTLVSDHGPQGAQAKDLDFLLNLGQIFTQVVYANLVAEAAALAIDGAPDGTRAGTTADVTGLTSAHVDRIFAVFVRDVSEYAVALHGQASATPEQRAAALSLVTAPQIDAVGESSLLAEVIGYAERG